MVLNLENGERIVIVTPQGIVVVGANEDSGSTLITVGSSEGYSLLHEVEVNENDGHEDFLTWIGPAVVEEENSSTEPEQ